MEENNFKKILIKIWPLFYKIINTVFYFFLSLLKGIVSRGFRQIKE